MKEIFKPFTFVFDFDSTVIALEALDEYFFFLMRLHPNQALQERFAHITELGMTGQMPFSQSLRMRVDFIIATGQANRTTLAEFVKELHSSVTPSFSRNKEFFITNAAQIFIISGGFKEMIVPVAKKLGIREDHIFANEFLYDSQGYITDYDASLLTVRDEGKAEQLQALNLDGDIIVIGDGMTDALMPRYKFIAYMGNMVSLVSRKGVIALADFVAMSFDEAFNYITSLFAERSTSS